MYAALDTQPLRLQPLQQRRQRLVVAALDRHDLGVRAAVWRIPEFLCRGTVPEIENQVQPLRASRQRCRQSLGSSLDRRRSADASRPAHRGWLHEDACSKLDVPGRQGFAGSEAHGRILDRPPMAVGMNRVEKPLELEKLGRDGCVVRPAPTLRRAPRASNPSRAARNSACASANDSPSSIGGRSASARAKSHRPSARGRGRAWPGRAPTDRT